MQKDYHPELITFEDVARHYLQEPASEEEADLGWFGLQSLTISEVTNILRRFTTALATRNLHPQLPTCMIFFPIRLEQVGLR